MGFLLVLVCFFQITNAQSPQKMSYQAVIRNAGNVLVANSNIRIRISILQSSAAGAVVYAETHSVMTNTNGLASLEIGGGTVESGNFSTINWANGPYFIKTETDPSGGTNYTITATSQMLSVPYALLSEKAVNPTYPAFVSDESTTFSPQTIRNIWVDDSAISVIVPETGKYLITFFGNAFNSNVYFSTDPDYDLDNEIRLFNNTTSTELFKTSTLVTYNDLYTASSAQKKLISIRPSRTIVENLNLGDELKLQYRQSASSGSISSIWNIGASGITITKIGN